jgi:hypothetical protein
MPLSSVSSTIVPSSTSSTTNASSQSSSTQTSQSLPFIDLSGTFYAQKNYINDLNATGSYIDPVVSSNLRRLSTNLDGINTQFGNASASSASILTNQQSTLDIVNTELNRLTQKKTAVDTALQGQQRMVQLNDSYREKTNYYIKMMIIAIIFIIAYIFINIIREQFPSIPEFAFDIFYVVLFIMILVSFYYTIYLDNVMNRDNLNFNELNYISPNDIKSQQNNQKLMDSGNLLNSINLYGCIGNNCCDPDTSVWDQGNSVCKGIQIQPFVSYSEYSNNTIKTNYACEGNDYSFYK